MQTNKPSRLITIGQSVQKYLELNVSTTPITAIGCRQCLPLSVVQLKGKHSWKPQCRNGIVDTFGHDLLYENIKVCEELIVLFKYIYNQIAIKAEAFC